MKKRFVSVVLALALALGLAVPSLATGQTFSDVPESYWGYADIEAVAEAGYMNGIGGGMFAPEMKVSVAQFLTLLGRLVFPDVKAEGADWYGPYVTAAQEAKLLDGTQVDVNNVEAEISRYDMAVILRAAAKKLGVAEKSAQSGEVTDYGMVPTMYADAVLAVYGIGLIRGDQAGNFNGSNTMMRAEVATVIMRLAKAKPGGSSQGGTTTDPEKPVEPEKPTEPEQPTEPQIVTARTWGSLYYYPTQGNGSWANDAIDVTSDGIPFKILYTEDGGKTSTLMGEGETTGICSYEIEFSVDKKLLNNPNGEFYVSAQFEKDGQRFVTQDLRTDGRQALSLTHVYEKGHGQGGDVVKLVPPDGQRWDFELEGKVPNKAMALAASMAPNIPPDIHKLSPAGFTVQLVCYPEPNLQDWAPTGKRIVIGETEANEDCTFVMPVSIDTVDMVDTKSFRIEFRGWYNGVEYFSRNTDELKTLGDIKTTPINAAWGVNLYHN